MLRRLNRTRLAAPWALLAGLSLTAACATDKASGAEEQRSTGLPGAPPPAAALSVQPLAVRAVPGPEEGSVDEELTRALRRAVARTTGAPVVDEVSARASLDACEDPAVCKTPVMNDFVRAEYVFTVRADRVGDNWFANGTAWRGTEVVGRVNEQDEDKVLAVARVGWALGERLRPRLVEVDGSGPEPGGVE